MQMSSHANFKRGQMSGGLMSYTRTSMLVMMCCNIFMNKNQNTFK